MDSGLSRLSSCERLGSVLFSALHGPVTGQRASLNLVNHHAEPGLLRVCVTYAEPVVLKQPHSQIDLGADVPCHVVISAVVKDGDSALVACAAGIGALAVVGPLYVRRKGRYR